MTDMPSRLPGPAPSNAGERTCERCGNEMRHLANLTALRVAPAVKVFRCYGCNNVASVPL